MVVFMNPAIILTGSRLVLAIIFSCFFITGVRANIYSADKVFLLISIITVIILELTDAFDGIVARKRQEVTRFGKIFDPVCDSISRQTIFCAFMYTGIIPFWMFIVFLYRDALNSFLRIMCAADGTVVAAKTSGKLKAIFQAIGTFLVLMVVFVHSNYPGLISKTWLGMHPGFWIMLFPAFFTVLSLFDYLVPSWPVLKKMMIPETENK